MMKQGIYKILYNFELAPKVFRMVLEGDTSALLSPGQFVNIKIDGLSARNYGSQGQQRSAALSLKLGEAAVIKSFSSEQPVALLDDVMSELDETRQNYILNHIKDWQVFITCCDPNNVKNLKSGKKFEMKNGKVK